MLETGVASSDTAVASNEELKALLEARADDFWPALVERSRRARSFEDLWALTVLRRRAAAAGLPGRPGAPVKLAVIGGCSTFPLHELMVHMLAVSGIDADLFLGAFDGYASELMDAGSTLDAFGPDVVLLLPSPARCRPRGRLSDPAGVHRGAAQDLVTELLDQCRAFHARRPAEILLANFLLPATFDPGAFRARTLGADWSFRKLVNLELGLQAPSFVHVCDLEFLAYRRGGLLSEDARGWFTSRQPCAPDLLVDLAQEVAFQVVSLRQGPKKVLVLDLDNTLWGGVVGDDGLNGIEIGDTSPRGEAFKTFQAYARSLTGRGVLLAVCSKNDPDKAREPFERHPEMVLRLDDFVSFKASWRPKSEMIREMAAELSLGLDSFVFADDNPAEIEIVRQFVPEVATILLGEDPAAFVARLQEARHFEPRAITAEDLQRTGQYRRDAERREAVASVTDMPAYLASLDMTASLRPFDALDAPRISQLVNKSNQFNLTTRRRTESEVLAIAADPACTAFSVRLRDRFGDHGLISVVIARVGEDGSGPALDIDTWLMSCRVLNRQVEEEVMNEIVRIARSRGCACVRGVYLPTARNGLVRDLLPRMGFRVARESPEGTEYELAAEGYEPFTTTIRLERGLHERV